MASLVGFFKKAVAQINPFDNGATWTNPNPPPRAPTRWAPPTYNAPRGFNAAQPQRFQSSGGGYFTNPQDRQITVPKYTAPEVIKMTPFTRAAVDVARSVPRSLVRIVGEGSNLQIGKKSPDNIYTPGDRVSKFVLGNKPVESFSKYGRDTGVKGAGGMALGVGLSALDVLPVPGKGKVAKELIEASTVSAAKKALKKLPGLTASSIERLAPAISKSKNSKFIEKAIKTETLTPGRAKQLTRIANKASDTPQLQPQLLDVPSSGISNELNVLNKLQPKTKPIPLGATLEQTRDVALKTTKAGNKLPI